jgi:hypothetical protein
VNVHFGLENITIDTNLGAIVTLQVLYLWYLI